MNEEDRDLIDKFVKIVTQKVPSIEAIILYGSLAREDFDKRSDIDLMIVIKEEQPTNFSPIISEIISDLKPHREIRTILTNMNDYDEDYYQNVIRDGRVLFGKLLLSPDNIALQPYLLISYDLSGKKNSLQVRISKKVHGYKSKKILDGKEKIYKYTGLIDIEGAKLVSKSALILPYSKGLEFINELNRLKITNKNFKIWM